MNKWSPPFCFIYPKTSVVASMPTFFAVKNSHKLIRSSLNTYKLYTSGSIALPLP